MYLLNVKEKTTHTTLQEIDIGACELTTMVLFDSPFVATHMSFVNIQELGNPGFQVEIVGKPVGMYSMVYFLPLLLKQ